MLPRAISFRTIAVVAAILLAVGAGAARAEEEHHGGGGGGEHQGPAGPHPGGAPHPGAGPMHAGPAMHGGPAAHSPAGLGHIPAGHADFRGFHGDPRHWDARHFAMWRGGGWHHGCYFGRCGWWWLVDGVWYWYAAPVYPFPLVVSAIVAADIAAAATMAPPLPGPGPAPYMPAPPPPPPGPTTYWFCASSGAYYPAVPTCTTPWQPVPAH
jgi:hypothetical protein